MQHFFEDPIFKTFRKMWICNRVVTARTERRPVSWPSRALWNIKPHCFMAYSNIHTFSDPEWDPLYSGSKTHGRPTRELFPADPHLPRAMRAPATAHGPRSTVEDRTAPHRRTRLPPSLRTRWLMTANLAARLRSRSFQSAGHHYLRWKRRNGLAVFEPRVSLLNHLRTGRPRKSEAIISFFWWLVCGIILPSVHFNDIIWCIYLFRPVR